MSAAHIHCVQKDLAMNFLNFFKSFIKDDSGAVTVDWVVLTAAIVGLALVVISNLQDPLEEAATAIGKEITAQSTYTSADEQ
jgi:Flp pilus assembly pilin Flp